MIFAILSKRVVQPVARPASPPPFGEIQIRSAHPISPGCHQLHMVIVANGCGYTQGLFWLPWRIAPVGQENQIEDVRFLFSPSTMPPLWPPKREYNAVSAERSMKFGSVVRVETLRHLTKITALRRKASKNKVLAAKHTASLQLLCTVGGSQATVNARTKFEISERSPKGGGEAGRATGCSRNKDFRIFV